MKKLFGILFGPWPSGLLILSMGIASTSKIANPGAGFFDSLWPVALAAMVGTYVPIVLHAHDHARRILSGEKINHVKATIARALFAAALVSVYHVYNFNPVKELLLMVFLSGWFGLVFNPTINSQLKHPVFHLGNTAVTDRVFNKYFGRFGGLAVAVAYALASLVAYYFYIQ
jgi:hypothetical protein